MNTFDPSCTEPGRWKQTPDADAPAPVILAYLQHCDACEFHAMLNLEDDLALDVLLRDACRDLVVSDGEQPVAAKTPPHTRSVSRTPPVRADRAPRAGLAAERYHFERNLTQACIAAFGIVVLWIAFTTYQGNLGASFAPPAAALEDAVPPAAVPLSVQTIADKNEGRLYLPSVSDGYEAGQLTHGGVLYEAGQLTASAPGLLPGSFLRVTNPVNGISVAVKVVQQTYADWEIVLSPRAADSLRLDGAAYVFVEVLSEPRSDPAAFAP
jgi:hypothetical protein